MKKVVLLSLFMIPAVVLASADAETSRYFMQTGRENDFIPRVVNFTIFIGLLYYLLANPIKSFFKDRSAGIEGQLAEIEQKLQDAKDKEKEAQTRLDESEKRADSIIADAKAEAIYLAEQIAKSNKSELAILEKQLEEKIDLAEKKSVRAIINDVLSENITNADIMLDEVKVVDIISKKVA